MKPIHLFTSMLAVTALFVTSCSTSRLANTNAIEDDVYNTTAQAKTYIETPRATQQLAQTDSESDEYYGTSDPYYDQDYSSRINRFYYANPWRTYYDGFYGNDPYAFNSYFSPFGSSWGFNNGWGSPFGWNNPFNNWAYYGAPYFNNYWGLYSYNNPYNWGGGFYGGGFYGGGYYGSIGGRNNANYGARPIRGRENGINRPGNTGYTRGSNGVIDRTSGSRAERYSPTNRTSGTATRTSEAAPNRSNGNARPTRSNDAPTRTYTPPTQSAPPPSSGSRGESGGSSGGNAGGGRPTRGGGR